MAVEIIWFRRDLRMADNPALAEPGARGRGRGGRDRPRLLLIFNPVLQQRKFDPDGVYVRRWVPELTELPDRHLAAPWEASEQVQLEGALRDRRGLSGAARGPEGITRGGHLALRRTARLRLVDRNGSVRRRRALQVHTLIATHVNDATRLF